MPYNGSGLGVGGGTRSLDRLKNLQSRAECSREPIPPLMPNALLSAGISHVIFFTIISRLLSKLVIIKLQFILLLAKYLISKIKIWIVFIINIFSFSVRFLEINIIKSTIF